MTNVVDYYEKFVAENGKSPLPVMALGLAGETGEALEHVKKFLRGDGPQLYANTDFARELGDVLFYLTWLGQNFGFTLDEIMALNMRKLIARKLAKEGAYSEAANVGS